MIESFLNGKVVLHCGDARGAVKTLADNSVDSLVGDPPYALVSIVKRFGAKDAAACKVPEGGSGAYARASSGFMGKSWDTGETAFDPAFWAECLRVVKPGGHLIMSSGTRTYHRLACAVEDAGFEIRDMLSWLYGSGFPKSHDVGRGLGRMLAGPSLREEWEGWGTALKPACEPCVFARKPLSENTVAANVLKHGTGAINIDGCRVGFEDTPNPATNPFYRKQNGYALHTGDDSNSTSWKIKSDRREQPAHSQGRWPANIIHDGSEEVVAAFPDAPGQQFALKGGEDSKAEIYGKYGPKQAHEPRGDGGSAARFFYTAKADADDRLGSKHPTVKPVDLMQWLVRLVTPKGGIVLDPFAGTGTTAEAAFREGMSCVLIEREAEYQADIRRRMALVLAGPEERKRESIKAKLGDVPFEPGSLFA